MENKTECELMKDFIDSNSDIALKYIMWVDLISEPQIFTNETNIDADDADFEFIN